MSESMSEWVLAIIIVLLASVLQAATGFGFSIMATPFLLLVFNSHDAIQINIIISLFISVVLTPGIWKEVDRILLKRISLGSAIGAPLGVIFFSYFSVFILKLTVSIVILGLTTVLMIRVYKNGKDPVPTAEVSGSDLRSHLPNANAMDHSRRNEFLVGLCSGFLTTSIGMPGPALLLYFNAKSIKKEVLRSTTLAFFIFVYTISLISQVITVETKVNVITSSLMLIPVAVLGIFLGLVLFKWVNQKVFKFMTYSILIYTGLYMLIKTI